jgi:phage terminase Nu1 subunit (DNA packaging protein)
VKHLNAEDVRPGRPVVVRVAAVVEMMVAKRVAEQSRPIDPEDPLLTAGDSPGLERYRLAKAAHAELDLAERKGELIDREKCRSVLAQWGSVLRRAGDRIARVNPEASRLLSEGLDECEAIVKGLE